MAQHTADAHIAHLELCIDVRHPFGKGHGAVRDQQDTEFVEVFHIVLMLGFKGHGLPNNDDSSDGRVNSARNLPIVDASAAYHKDSK